MAVVTCVGLAVADSVFSIDGSVNIGEKNFATGLTRTGGGPAANGAVTVACLGGSARLVSVVGTDATGDALVAELRDAGVDTKRVRRSTTGASPESMVIADGGGGRTIVNRTDGALWQGQSVSEDDLEGADAVLVDLRWTSGALSAIRIASSMGVPTVVDFDLTEGEVPDALIQEPSHVIFSRPALAALTGSPDPALALEMVPGRSDRFVGVTLGAEGTMWRQGGSTHSFDAFDVTVHGTLGAGDVFHGAFTLGLAEGMDTVANIRRSSAAAAIMCMRGGGRAGIPTRADVDAFLERTRR